MNQWAQVILFVVVFLLIWLPAQVWLMDKIAKWWKK